MKPLSKALSACFLCSVSVAAIADVRLVSLSPSSDDTVGTSVPEMLIEFSGPVDPATATMDSVRIYSIGDAALTPGPDDTRLAIATVTPEEGNTRLRITAQDPLPDGPYA